MDERDRVDRATRLWDCLKQANEAWTKAQNSVPPPDPAHVLGVDTTEAAFETGFGVGAGVVLAESGARLVGGAVAYGLVVTGNALWTFGKGAYDSVSALFSADSDYQQQQAACHQQFGQ